MPHRLGDHDPTTDFYSAHTLVMDSSDLKYFGRDCILGNSTPSVRRYLIGGDIQTTEVKTIILSRLLLKFKRMKVATDDSKECGMTTLTPERGGMKNKKDLFKSGTRRSLLFPQKAV
ncbi:hypothetical protein TNCV_3848401 [Trichonephila clavipes]|uniref:Uncharacterized protein n=1 Tax=Trichonephila clavipes TaxID=2585209 RepID=A0A8X6RA12_TRICX|nr:hypothetical protein TNCV_3848401 [Trichonephila clavipes]